MTELLTAAQMRALEQAAIESGEVSGLELMERAGRGVVEAVFEEWPELAKAPHRAVVLCGPGNNGGDGFVVARLLKEWGWEVEVFLYGDPEKLPPDAKVNYERWGEMGEVVPISKITDRFYLSNPEGSPAAIVMDAIFGTGLTREPEGFGLLIDDIVFAAEYFDTNKSGSRVVAIDVPSSLSSDSGELLGDDSEIPGDDAFVSNLTVSFHTAKVGHHLKRGPLACGKLVVKSIGLEGRPRPRVGVKPPPDGAVGGCPAVPPGEVVKLVERSSLPVLRKFEQTHKFSHGHALILSGGPGRTGAARLAARGALRIGAGLVTLGVPGAAQMEVAAQVTAIMLRRAGTPGEVGAVLEDDRINAVCLGPGLGVERARELVPVASGARGLQPPCMVLDADALTAYADDPEVLFAILHGKCVLTPHGGEFARLFPDLSERLRKEPSSGPAYSKVDATREAAKRAGCVVLFKGPDTVIAAPDGRCSINSAQYDRAAPWLATAGSGDVLAGFITGLLARGVAPMQAAETAAWLHVECALGFGPGLVAEDLPEQLPGVFRALSL